MIGNAQILARECDVRAERALLRALRAKAKGLLEEINRERGEGYLYLSECLSVGFFMLFERMPMTILARKRGQDPDWSRELMFGTADVDGYARLVLRLEEVKKGN